MQHTFSDETLALAGIAQAVYLVQQIARRGQADEDAIAASLGSLFKIDADNVPDVFGGIRGVEVGLRQLSRQLGGAGLDPEQAGYASTLLILERKFLADPDRVAAVRAGLQRISVQAEQYPSLLDDAIVAELSALYRERVSTLTPRVMVGGDPMQLRQTRNTDRVRALLLAGLRAAVLWRQCGGSRWRLLIHRRRVMETAKQLLEQV